MVRRAVLDVCVHEPRPHASVTQAATWEHVPPGRQVCQPHGASDYVFGADLGNAEGLLDLGAAFEQFAVGHARGAAGSRRLHCGRFGMAAKIPLDGPFRAHALEAYGVGRRIPVLGDVVSVKASAKTKHLFGIQPVAQYKGRPPLLWEPGAEGHAALSSSILPISCPTDQASIVGAMCATRAQFAGALAFGRRTPACWDEHAGAAGGISAAKTEVRRSSARCQAVQRHGCGSPCWCEHATARAHVDSGTPAPPHEHHLTSA